MWPTRGARHDNNRTKKYHVIPRTTELVVHSSAASGLQSLVEDTDARIYQDNKVGSGRVVYISTSAACKYSCTTRVYRGFAE